MSDRIKAKNCLDVYKSTAISANNCQELTAKLFLIGACIQFYKIAMSELAAQKALCIQMILENVLIRMTLLYLDTSNHHHQHIRDIDQSLYSHC